MTDDSARSFTSWKMDWINVLMAGLDHREFRVAVCLLQRANSRTRAIVPSQAYIAAYLDCSVRAVERAISELVRMGWLEKRRARRYLPNAYRFVEAKRDEMGRALELRLEDFKAHRWDEEDPTEVSDFATDVSGPDGENHRSADDHDPTEVSQIATDVGATDPTEVAGKHLKQHHSLSSEDSVGEAARVAKMIPISDALRTSRAMRRAG